MDRSQWRQWTIKLAVCIYHSPVQRICNEEWQRRKERTNAQQVAHPRAKDLNWRPTIHPFIHPSSPSSPPATVVIARREERTAAPLQPSSVQWQSESESQYNLRRRYKFYFWPYKWYIKWMWRRRRRRFVSSGLDMLYGQRRRRRGRSMSSSRRRFPGNRIHGITVRRTEIRLERRSSSSFHLITTSFTALLPPIVLPVK